MKLDINNYEMVLSRKAMKVKGGPFINREMSLIDFNDRVLYYALSKKVPLNERLNFLAITGSNMDEMISVRFADTYANKDVEPYNQVLKGIKKFKSRQREASQKLISVLNDRKIKFVKPSDLNKDEKEELLKEYTTNIFPLLTPLIEVDGEIPNITSGTVCVVVTIMMGTVETCVFVPICSSIDLVYQIGNKVLLTEDIIKFYMNDTLFINKTIIKSGVFRIIRDASVILSHDRSRFIVDRMEDTLRNREHGKPLFMDVTSDTDERLVNILTNVFKIPTGHLYRKSEIINYKRFSQIKIDGDENSYKPFKPFRFENSENYFNLFDAIKDQDILLQHPYDSYETVVKFIQHAATDDDVVAIKQTLYRVSSINSPIVEALCEASRRGKQVTVLIEIKARFDESNNIQVIKKLEKAGAHVITGDEWLKTHCKLCIVVRKEKDELKIYSHVATGNYNEKTARLYTDLSYFTNKQKIGNDLLSIFNILSGYSNPDENMKKIYYAPVNLRKMLIKCIDREISNAKKGKSAEIFMKINSFSDPIMANKIYEAADKGVRVYIICRGVCSIVPRKNLYIKSIVGRFLEHSRIYYFKNGKDHEYYISSADLLTRNLDKRVEILISLKESDVIKQLKWIIEVYKQDTENSFVMTKDGHWIHIDGDFSSHDWFIKHTDERKRKKKWKK